MITLLDEGLMIAARTARVLAKRNETLLRVEDFQVDGGISAAETAQLRRVLSVFEGVGIVLNIDNGYHWRATTSPNKLTALSLKLEGAAAMDTLNKSRKSVEIVLTLRVILVT